MFSYPILPILHLLVPIIRYGPNFSFCVSLGFKNLAFSTQNISIATILNSFDKPEWKDAIRVTCNLNSNPLYVLEFKDIKDTILRSALRRLSGVYGWFNTSELSQSGRVLYVGGAINMGMRPFRHIEEFPTNTNIRLTHALDKYGRNSFVLVIFAAVETNTLPHVRKDAIDQINKMETHFLQTVPKALMYNFVYTAGCNPLTEATNGILDSDSVAAIEKISGSNNHASLAVTVKNTKTGAEFKFATITAACLFVKCSRSTFARAQLNNTVLKKEWLILDVQMPKAPLSPELKVFHHSKHAVILVDSTTYQEHFFASAIEACEFAECGRMTFSRTQQRGPKALLKKRWFIKKPG